MRTLQTPAAVGKPADVRPPLTARLALWIMQLGAFVVVLAASTWTPFELDRFLIPKELVLHATATLAGLLMYRAIARLEMTRVDTLFVSYLLLSAASAALAVNGWLAFRALAVSASSLVIFWTARALRNAGLDGKLLNAVAAAVVLVAITSLVQAYGMRSEFFALSRAPGGTLGNRNFVGHVAAFGLPIVIVASLRDARSRSRLFGAIGMAIVGAALVLTRSRAAWLACVISLLIVVSAFMVRRIRGNAAVVGPLAPIVLAVGIGIAAAVILPNSLRWKSARPYLDTATSVATYAEGSGRGRLRQYAHSSRMAFAHLGLGVGPGNWPVQYPRYAPDDDGSLNPSEPGTTFNPWPSSDWIALVAERGPMAAAAIGVGIAIVAFGALRHIATTSAADDAMSAMALVAVVIGACVAGAFDAVLLLPVPSLIVWAAVGALWTPRVSTTPTVSVTTVPLRVIPKRLAFMIVLVSMVGVSRSLAQVAAMEVFVAHGDRASLERASRLDPGNYRLQMRLARGGGRERRCAHALAARSLFPNAESARTVARDCRE